MIEVNNKHMICVLNYLSNKNLPAYPSPTQLILPSSFLLKYLDCLDNHLFRSQQQNGLKWEEGKEEGGRIKEENGQGRVYEKEIQY